MNAFEAPPNQLDIIKQRVTENIDRAASKPISELRLSQLGNRLDTIKEQFVARGFKTDECRQEEREIISEILESSATAKTLLEFKEVLSQLVNRYGLSQEWADDTLEHENAHANVAAITGHDFVCYATVFVDEGDGHFGLDPICVIEDNVDWGPAETLIHNIATTDAPRIYGNALSPGDEESIQRDEALLHSLQNTENKKAA